MHVCTTVQAVLAKSKSSSSWLFVLDQVFFTVCCWFSWGYKSLRAKNKGAPKYNGKREHYFRRHGLGTMFTVSGYIYHSFPKSRHTEGLKYMVYNDTTKHKNVGCNPIFQSTKQQWNAEKWDVGYLPGVGWAVLIVLLLSSVFGRRLAWPLSKLRFLSVHKVKKLSCLCSYFANVSLCCIDMYICCSSMYMYFVLCI